MAAKENQQRRSGPTSPLPGSSDANRGTTKKEKVSSSDATASVALEWPASAAVDRRCDQRDEPAVVAAVRSGAAAAAGQAHAAHTAQTRAEGKTSGKGRRRSTNGRRCCTRHW